MADVLIKGMEMPVSCFGCPLIALQNDGGTHCKLTCTSCEIRKLNDDCPLHELPEHGDLIDRDAFRAENEYYLHREFINPKYEDTLDDLLKDAPVIVPASKEETE